MTIQTLPVGPLATNCYLVLDQAARLCAVVDPGAEAEKIAAAVEQTGCAPACILLTHGHDDHTGAVEALQERWSGVPVYLNKRDCYPADEPAIRGLFLPMHGDVRSYDEGDTVEVGALRFQVLATPGHTEGGVTLRCGDALFCGDTLFAGSCGRTDFFGGDTEKLMASLRRLGQLEGDFAVLPGHMRDSTLARERQTNPYLRHALQSGQ